MTPDSERRDQKRPWPFQQKQGNVRIDEGTSRDFREWCAVSIALSQQGRLSPGKTGRSAVLTYLFSYERRGGAPRNVDERGVNTAPCVRGESSCRFQLLELKIRKEELLVSSVQGPRF